MTFASVREKRLARTPPLLAKIHSSKLRAPWWSLAALLSPPSTSVRLALRSRGTTTSRFEIGREFSPTDFPVAIYDSQPNKNKTIERLGQSRSTGVSLNMALIYQEQAYWALWIKSSYYLLPVKEKTHGPCWFFCVCPGCEFYQKKRRLAAGRLMN